MVSKKQRRTAAASSRISRKSSQARKSTEYFASLEPVSVRVPRFFPPKSGQTCSASTYFTTELKAETLLPGKIYVIPKFLTDEECDSWCSFCGRADFLETTHPASRDTAFRDNGRIELWDTKAAEVIWSRLHPFVPEHVDGMRAVGCYEKIRLYRYKPAQRFGMHIDESTPGTVAGTYTAITVLIYLNGSESGLRGGETVFYSGSGTTEVVRFVPAAGTLLFHGFVVTLSSGLFLATGFTHMSIEGQLADTHFFYFLYFYFLFFSSPLFRSIRDPCLSSHGQNCLLHEALPVSSGVKFVLRTDVRNLYLLAFLPRFPQDSIA